MKGLVKVFVAEMRARPLIFWIKATPPLSQNLDIEPVLRSKRFTQKTGIILAICERMKQEL